MQPLMLIRWMDAQDHEDAWVHSQVAEQFGEEVCEIISTGFLIKKTNKYFTIGSDWDASDGNYGRVTKIPVSMIIEVLEIPLPSKEPADV